MSFPPSPWKVLCKAAPSREIHLPISLARHRNGAYGEVLQFEGTFDENHLMVFYEGEKFKLDGPHFWMEIYPNNLEKDPLQAGGSHFVDLQDWSHSGSLRVAQGRYYQKNFDFFLEDISASINFENHTIHIQDINAHSEGIQFHGDVKTEIHSLNDIDLRIAADSLSGSCQGARSFISHFKPSLFWNIPFEGDIFGRKETLFFHYKFKPRAELIVGRVNGEVSLNLSTPFAHLQNYHAEIFCDCKEGSVELKNGLGKVSLPGKSEALIVKSPSNQAVCISRFSF